MTVKGLLNVGHHAVFLQAFDGRDRTGFDLRDGGKASANLVAVDKHRARATVAGVASDLSSSQAEPVSQHVREAGYGFGDHGVLRAIHSKGNRMLERFRDVGLIGLIHLPVQSMRV